ncbi:hypothetical protein FBQ97_10960, partial [Acidobacteria bacterium ACD]|nr:hypothetical protein [Acidobacteria bacterium ACD]
MVSLGAPRKRRNGRGARGAAGPLLPVEGGDVRRGEGGSPVGGTGRALVRGDEQPPRPGEPAGPGARPRLRQVGCGLGTVGPLDREPGRARDLRGPGARPRARGAGRRGQEALPEGIPDRELEGDGPQRGPPPLRPGPPPLELWPGVAAPARRRGLVVLVRHQRPAGRAVPLPRDRVGPGRERRGGGPLGHRGDGALRRRQLPARAGGLLGTLREGERRPDGLGDRRPLAGREGGGGRQRGPLAGPLRRGRRGRLPGRAVPAPRPAAGGTFRPRDPGRRRLGEQRRAGRAVPGGLPVRRLCRAAAAAGALLLLCGCGRTGKDPESVVRRRLEGEPKTLNPLLATADPELVVLALTSRNLVDWDEELALVPGLAESAVESDDHRSFTFRLREGARWEDGTPVTADDVVFTVEALVDPRTPAPNRRAFFEGFEKAEKLDGRTARVSFRNATPGRLAAFNLPLLPAAAYRGKDLTTHPMNRQPLSNGPYRVARWEAGRRIDEILAGAAANSQ